MVVEKSTLKIMTSERIIECIESLKIKNTEDYDRIPQIIINGLDALCKPLVKLFQLVYWDIAIEQKFG